MHIGLTINLTKITYCIILFLFITDLNWIILPLSTRKIIGIVGFIYIALNKFRVNQNILLDILFMYLLGGIILFFSSILGGGEDFSFWGVLLNRIFIALGGYYIYAKWKNYSLEEFLKQYVNIVLINDLIALLLFLSPTLNSIAVYLQPVSENAAELFSGLRLIGIGAFRFFEGGIFNALALICIVFLYLKKVFSVKKAFGYFSLILFLGMFIARTTMLGLVAFLFVLSPSFSNFKRLWKLGILLLMGVVGIFLVLNILLQDSEVMKFAFELILNIIDKGEFATKSTNGLLTMYIFPDSWKTWLIGDGMWMQNGYYYMSTDVGYCRLLFLWGIIGTLIFFSFTFSLSRKSMFNQSKLNKNLVKILFLFLLIINVKGFSDFTFLYFPVLFYLQREKEFFLNSCIYLR